jgi:peptidoglycan/LPS O-acetylase OafA/YrhL
MPAFPAWQNPAECRLLHNRFGGFMKASSLCFRAAVLFGIAGMAWGIDMAVRGDHTQFPAHAHLNLLGWVSLFLIGVFYRLHPALERSRVALLQAGLWCLGTLVLSIGVALITAGGQPAGEPLAGIGALLLLADMLLFALLVWRAQQAASAT